MLWRWLAMRAAPARRPGPPGRLCGKKAAFAKTSGKRGLFVPLRRNQYKSPNESTFAKRSKYSG